MLCTFTRLLQWSPPFETACSECEAVWLCGECRQSRDDFMEGHKLVCRAMCFARVDKQLKTDERKLLRHLPTLPRSHTCLSSHARIIAAAHIVPRQINNISPLSWLDFAFTTRQAAAIHPLRPRPRSKSKKKVSARNRCKHWQGGERRWSMRMQFLLSRTHTDT